MSPEILTEPAVMERLEMGDSHAPKGLSVMVMVSVLVSVSVSDDMAKEMVEERVLENVNECATGNRAAAIKSGCRKAVSKRPEVLLLRRREETVTVTVGIIFGVGKLFIV